MAADPPPDHCEGLPVRVVLPAGGRLLRVHRVGGRHGPADFNRTVPVPPEGGRFDTVDGTYGHLYVAVSAAGAVAEALLRGRGGPTATQRILPRAALVGRAMSELELLAPVTVVSLRGPDVGHVCQDAWLTKCEAYDYPLTRLWGAAIRRWAINAAGMLWWARKNEHELVAVLYDDRLPPPIVRAIGAAIPVDRGPGLDMVVSLLAAHNVTVARSAGGGIP